MDSVSAKVLRISIVTETYLPEINGVANTLQRLVEGLRRRGHRVHLIRPGQKGERAAKSHSDRAEPEKINHGPPDPLLHPDQLPAEAAEPVTREPDGGCRNSLSPAGRGVGERRSKGAIGAFCNTLPDGERHETLVPSLPIPSYPGLPVYRRLRRMWRETPPGCSLYRHPRATALRHDKVQRLFAVVSRLGDGVFWYSLIAVMSLVDGRDGLYAGLAHAADGRGSAGDL